MVKPKWYAPIYIKSNLEKERIIPGIRIEPLPEKEVQNLLGINRRVNDQGIVTYYELVHPSPVAFFELRTQRNLCHCNYVIILNDENYKEIVDMSIRLINLGNVGLAFLKTKEKFGGPWELFSPYSETLPFSKINKSDLPGLRKLVKKTKETKNVNYKKLKLVMDRYRLATCSNPYPLENRFVDLNIILEMLFLQKKDSGEVKFRLTTRIAKLFKIEYEEDSEDTFDKFSGSKGFYNIRSEIVHSGKSKNLNQGIFRELADIVRKAICLFIFEPQLFEKDNFKKLDLNLSS